MNNSIFFKVVAPFPMSTLRQAQDDASGCHSELVAPEGLLPEGIAGEAGEKEWQTPCETDL